MPKKVDADNIEPSVQQGEVIEQTLGWLFNVKIAEGVIVKCTLPRIRALPSEILEWMPKVGEAVAIEQSPNDPSRGRILYIVRNRWADVHFRTYKRLRIRK